MDWANADARDVVLAICGHWRLDFAQAEDYLLARQLQEAEDQGAGGAQGAEEEDEEEEVADDAVIIPMPGRELVTVGAAVVGTATTAKSADHSAMPILEWTEKNDAVD